MTPRLSSRDAELGHRTSGGHGLQINGHSRPVDGGHPFSSRVSGANCVSASGAGPRRRVAICRPRKTPQRFERHPQAFGDQSLRSVGFHRIRMTPVRYRENIIHLIGYYNVFTINIRFMEEYSVWMDPGTGDWFPAPLEANPIQAPDCCRQVTRVRTHRFRTEHATRYPRNSRPPTLRCCAGPEPG